VKAIAISISTAKLDWFASREEGTPPYLVALEDKMTVHEQITVWIRLIFLLHQDNQRHPQ
jgi:hypothetical protein